MFTFVKHFLFISRSVNCSENKGPFIIYGREGMGEKLGGPTFFLKKKGGLQIFQTRIWGELKVFVAKSMSVHL